MRTIHSIGNYLPSRSSATYSSAIRFRRFIWQFKDGNEESARIAANMIATEILNNFDNLHTHFICAPASTPRIYEKRYKLFSQLVCKHCGMINDFDKVRYFGTRLAIHSLDDRGANRQINAMMCCSIKVEAGAKYVIFDDIITKGKTFETIADYIESKGGKVVAGYFLGKTMFTK